MNLEEFENATDSDLRRKASECLARLETEPLDRTASLLEAKLYVDEIKDREHEKRSRRARWIEGFAIFIEILVVFLIWLELRGSDQQLGVLQKLNTSAGETATTLAAVRKAQESSLNIFSTTLQPQVDLLSRTHDTLEDQLKASKRQQKLISQQLAIQESIIAEQQRKPTPDLRAFTYTKTGSAFETLSQNALSLVAYAPSSMSSDYTRSVSLVFVARNVGTAPLINFAPLFRVPESIQIKCIDYPAIRLFGETPEECGPALGRIAPIYPVPKNTPSPKPSSGPFPDTPPGTDFTFRAVLTVPERSSRFDILIELAGDNLFPTYYRMQCVPASTFKPSIP
jgi:hypothetical protein